MSSTISYHIEKHKKTVVNALQKHDERKRGQKHKNKRIKDDLTQHNIFLKSDNRTYKKRIEDELERRYKARRAPRSDAVALVSQTIQIGGDLAEKSLNEQIEVLRACHDFISQKNGFDNVISSVIHLDETTSHLHISYVPLTNDGRLSAKERTSRKELQKMQNELLKFVQDRFSQHDFKRASEQERGFSNGKTQADFERLQEEKRQAEEVIKNGLKQIKNEQKKIIELDRERAKKSQELSKKELSLTIKEKSVNQKEKIIDEKIEKLEKEKRAFEKLKEDVLMKFNQLIEFAKNDVFARRHLRLIVEKHEPITDEKIENFGYDLDKSLRDLNKTRAKEKVL